MNPKILDSAVEAAVKIVPEIADTGSSAVAPGTRSLRNLIAADPPGGRMAVLEYLNLSRLFGRDKADTAILAPRNEISRRRSPAAMNAGPQSTEGRE